MEHGRRICAGHFLMPIAGVDDTFLEVFEFRRFGSDDLNFPF